MRIITITATHHGTIGWAVASTVEAIEMATETSNVAELGTFLCSSSVLEPVHDVVDIKGLPTAP